MERVVLHLDMDAFYAAVEVREDPRLAGRPLIVGHRGRRGVVSTCSYEARAFGVRSAMASLAAERLCPQAHWLAPRMELYAEVSRLLFEILARHSPSIEPLSIDEAFVDLSGIAPDLAAGRDVARRIQQAIETEQRLTASAGIAPNKFLAKLASDLEKPRGLVVLSLDELPARVWPLPVERLWGVGPRTAALLGRGGIRTIGEVHAAGRAALAALVGAHLAAHLGQLAAGRDDRPVQAQRSARSISEERTYGDDLFDPQVIDREILARASAVARTLRREGLAARTVHLKVRAADYRTWTRALTLAAPTDLAEPIVAAARRLLGERIDLGGRGVRLLGVGTSGLVPAGAAAQGCLFADAGEGRARRRARAADAVRSRLGQASIVRARLLDRPDPRARS
jgi:DNA polymerase-4